MKISRECRVARRAIDETQTDTAPAQHARAHIASCSSCRAAHEQQQRLFQLVASLPQVMAPADFDIRLRARLRARESGRTNWFRVPGFALGTRALAIAAAVVVLVGMVVLVNQMGLLKGTVAPDQQASKPPQQKENNLTPPAPMIAVTQAGPTSTAVGKPETDPAANTPKPQNTNNLAKRNGLKSYDEAVSPAPAIKRTEGEQSTADVSLKPFEFSLQDSQGVTHKFSLPPVTFGSQQLVRRDPYRSASYAGNRVW